MKPNTLTKVIFCVFLTTLFLTYGYGQDEVSSTWVEKGVKIDGLDQEWAGAKFYTYKDCKIDHAFLSDANNLYILFIFKDAKFMSTVFQKGLTVWVNNQGKKKKNFGINFLRRMITPETFITLIEKQYKRKLTEKNKADIKKKKYYTINQSVIVKEGGEGFVSAGIKGKYRPAFKVGKRDKFSLFEIKIPIKDMQGTGFDASPGDKIALAFSWGGMTKAMVKQMRQRQASGAQRAGGLRGRRVQDPDIPGYGANVRRIRAGAEYSVAAMRKKYSFWTFLTLAVKK